jgi:hypothetical protein
MLRAWPTKTATRVGQIGCGSEYQLGRGSETEAGRGMRLCAGQERRKGGRRSRRYGWCAQADLLESHIRGLAACTPPWRSRTYRTGAVEASAFARTRRRRPWCCSAAGRTRGGAPLTALLPTVPPSVPLQHSMALHRVVCWQFGETVHGV